MENFNRREHWERIYQSKQHPDMSWFQPTPQTSLDFLKSYKVELNDSIIDIGGGDSLLVDHLLDAGFTDITVLDISSTAIDRAKARLGDRARRVNWIVSDILSFTPTRQYDCWHDRATFHFLTEDHEINTYLDIAQKSLRPEGLLIMGTFSEQGPKTCSGIAIRQYSANSMTLLLHPFFDKLRCITLDHKTPFDTLQSFVFCSFRKRDAISEPAYPEQP